MHNAMPWSGSGSPGYTGVAAHWNLPKQGQPTTCLSWDGTDFSAAGAKEWPGTVASPAAVNQSELEVSNSSSRVLLAGCRCSAALAGTHYLGLLCLPSMHACTPGDA